MSNADKRYFVMWFAPSLISFYMGIIFYEHKSNVSDSYSTFDIANIEGAQVRHSHCSNCCYVAILIGKTACF